jgi:hypothetical protein
MNIKNAIWLYFFLWFFEGALRKWFLPGLATPLLIVRDPVAIYILYKAFKDEVKFVNNYVRVGFVCTMLSVILTLMIGHGNLAAALFGARIMFIHFPLMFVIGSVFTQNDLIKMGHGILVLTPILTIILLFQFYSPQTAWINVGVGGEGSSGFNGAMDYFRPSGTFTFISGPALFLPLSCVYIVYFWSNPKYCSKLLLYISTVSLIIATPITISRSCVFAVALVLIFFFLGSLNNVKNLVRVFKLAVTLLVILFIMKNVPVFNTGVEVFSSRLEGATEAEATEDGGILEGIYTRLIVGSLSPIDRIFEFPLFSGRLGMGTNAGAMLLRGNTGYLIDEGEVGRIIGESGAIIGMLIVGLRLTLSVSMFTRSFAKTRQNELLPWLFYSIVGFTFVQGQMGQPTQLGFMVLVGGFLLAGLDKETV